MERTHIPTELLVNGLVLVASVFLTAIGLFGTQDAANFVQDLGPLSATGLILGIIAFAYPTGVISNSIGNRLLAESDWPLGRLEAKAAWNALKAVEGISQESLARLSGLSQDLQGQLTINSEKFENPTKQNLYDAERLCSLLRYVVYQHGSPLTGNILRERSDLVRLVRSSLLIWPFAVFSVTFAWLPVHIAVGTIVSLIAALMLLGLLWDSYRHRADVFQRHSVRAFLTLSMEVSQ